MYIIYIYIYVYLSKSLYDTLSVIYKYVVRHEHITLGNLISV